jgi:hypothetical protein
MMAVDALIATVQKMHYPQSLDPGYDGSCPCFVLVADVDDGAVVIEGSCWRVGDSSEFQDLRVGGSLSKEELLRIGEAFKKQLDKQAWVNPYRIIMEG